MCFFFNLKRTVGDFLVCELRPSFDIKKGDDVSGTRSVCINRREVGEGCCCVCIDTGRHCARRRDGNIILIFLELTNRKKRRW